MPHIDPPNYRQQRALGAIGRAVMDFDIALRARTRD
jgi:hypothetical protein